MLPPIIFANPSFELDTKDLGRVSSRVPRHFSSGDRALPSFRPEFDDSNVVIHAHPVLLEGTFRRAHYVPNRAI